MSALQPSQERLNQIAGRKLGELGLSSVVGEGGKLVGEIPAQGALENPFNHTPIDSLRFVVEDHDHVRFLSPPLVAGLAPLQFFDCPDAGALLERVGRVLLQRRDAIARLKTHLAHLRVDAQIDGEHGVLVAPVTLDAMGTVVLIGDEQGLRSSHLRPVGGGPNLPMQPLSIDLSQFADASDLSAFVSDLAQRAQPAPDAVPTTGIYRPLPEFMGGRPGAGYENLAAPNPAGSSSQPRRGAVADADEFMPPSQAFEVPQSIAGGARGQPAHGEVPAGAVTAGMLARCLGDTAQLAHGVAVMRKFDVNGRTLKLTLRQKRGRVFVGRVAFEEGALWQGEIDVDKHPPMDEFVYELLRSQGLDLGFGAAPPAPAASREPASAPPPSPSPPPPPKAAAPKAAPAFGEPGGERLPAAGEIWVMKVVVEQEDAREVRYSAINAEGQPYGAPRILPKGEFDKVFARHESGSRLLVRVLGASPQQIVYVQLDPQYQPNSETRGIAPSIFLANFLPEAADR